MPSVAGSILKKFLHPLEVWRIVRLQRARKKTQRAYDDAQLKLYSRILEGDFLHYGYFDDVDVRPEDLSLSDIYKAQRKYAELIVDRIADPEEEVLDIGCGMGGLLKLALDRGLKPAALTPDKTQCHYIKAKYPNVRLYECRFEDIPVEENRHRYGTLITSESLQYLHLDRALSLLSEIARPNARWIVCDYFRVNDGAGKSGHRWSVFTEKTKAAGWVLTHEQDITPNVLPTIGYVHMWGSRIFLPLFEFGKEKLEVKHPGYHYGLSEAIDILAEKLQENLDVVNPETFSRNKRYKLLVLERG